MDRIGNFLVANKNNWTFCPDGEYTKTFPSGTVVTIVPSEGRKTLERKNGSFYILDKQKSRNGAEISTLSRSFFLGPKSSRTFELFKPTPTSKIKTAQRLKNILSKILPSSINEVLHIRVIKGKWMRLG